MTLVAMSRRRETVQTRTVEVTRAQRATQQKEDPNEECTTEQHVPRRIFGKTTPQERAVAVTTQEAPNVSCEKTMRIANVENNALNWVSNSSGGALDMTHCDFGVRSARDEMKSSFGPTKIRTGGSERRTRITWNSCVSCMKRRWRTVAVSCMS